MQPKFSEEPEKLPDFDDYADNYELLVKDNIKASGFPPSYFDEHKIKTLAADFLKKPFAGDEIRFLNFGCGIGKSEQFIHKYLPGARTVSVDVSKSSLDRAMERNRNVPHVTYQHFNDVTELTYDQPFDIIFAANVFHHIPNDLRLPILAHLRTLLSPNGYLYIFEHNPFNPLTKAAFDTCEFDQGCKMIPARNMSENIRKAGFKSQTRHYIVFFPKPLSSFIPYEKYLDWLPIGAQYYIKAQ
ncbi:class I SAM-dependent methyltransferase [Telluribacter sp.]|jgi:SAM-dependent methyltransferase|uniref:class I SAM-dependent methyltransferase n=1 Tax=Telluribacter sp. TaxID=1978767 RepID=UPI002E1546E9|nr:class I SAM-dependent methyltransferase [Telluribacter sp.]